MFTFMPSTRARQSGFTLLEVVVAISILAVGLGMAMRGLAGAMQQSRQASEQTIAALHAQSVLDAMGVGERLEQGDYHGEFEDGFRWHAAVMPYEVATDSQGPDFDPALSQVDLLKVELVMEWPHGQQTAEAHFSTLRAVRQEL